MEKDIYQIGRISAPDLFPTAIKMFIRQPPILQQAVNLSDNRREAGQGIKSRDRLRSLKLAILNRAGLPLQVMHAR
jgi:hypothetical protein